MRYRRFGRTGLEVSELVLGGGWVGGLLIHADDDTRRRAVRLALDRGINWIDTAPSYGNGASEEALGWLLGELDERPHLSTKVRLDPTHLHDIPAQIEDSVAASLRRLRCDSVTLLQLHNPIARQPAGGAVGVAHVLGPGGVAEAFDRLKARGITQFTGITALGDGAACRQVAASGRFDSAQVYYNILNPSAARVMPPAWTGHDFAELIATCRAHDVAVMNIRVLAAGVLATDERHGREVVITSNTAIPDEERRAHAVADALGDAYGTRAQTAIRFALANPDIACVLVGVATLRHLQEALDAVDLGPLSDDALARLEPLYAGDFGAA
jgi:L-galactose dehydrogenase/L-glyceraldehyde 3-phosphate reductase